MSFVLVVIIKIQALGAGNGSQETHGSSYASLSSFDPRDFLILLYSPVCISNHSHYVVFIIDNFLSGESILEYLIHKTPRKETHMRFSLIFLSENYEEGKTCVIALNHAIFSLYGVLMLTNFLIAG